MVALNHIPVRVIEEQLHGAVGAGGGTFELNYALGFELGFDGEDVVHKQREVVMAAEDGAEMPVSRIITREDCMRKFRFMLAPAFLFFAITAVSAWVIWFVPAQ